MEGHDPDGSPGIITVTIFNFMNIWNEYFMALIFANGNDKIRTLSMGLQNMITSMKYTGDWAGPVCRGHHRSGPNADPVSAFV